MAPSTLLSLLQEIDDELVPVGRVLGAIGLDALAILLRADWLRMVSVERGLGPVLWRDAPEAAIARLGAGSDEGALVKLTPAGANALHALASGTQTEYTPRDLGEVAARVAEAANARDV